jgi:polyphosphate kinase
VIGRFLEHSRVFWFANAGEPELFLGSADWMPRNFFRRIEVVFPVEDPALRDRIVTQILAIQLADNTKASLLAPDGTYSRPVRKKDTDIRGSQVEFMALALGEKKTRRVHRPVKRAFPKIQVVRMPR